MSKKTLFASYALLSFSLAWTQPSQPHLTEGDASFCSLDSKTLEIQVAHRTKIEWNEFSIAQGETTRFIQPSTNSVVINQVTGLYSSNILGALTANGQVYLINPQGIFIGPDAFIQTAGFVATTFDQLTLDEGGIPLHFKGDSRATLTHLGQIKTASGQVTLVAAHVDNLGNIEGHDITVASAPEVWIKPTEKGIYLIPQVSIQEIEASSDPMEFVIKQEGLIRATGCVENQGRIYLVSSQRINVNGSIQAAGGSVDVLGDHVMLGEKALIDVSHAEKGGSVRVGGDYQGANIEVPNASHTIVQKGATILTNGLEGGDGGRVIVWGNKSCDFQGSIEGLGGKLYGNGGFVEISSPLGLNFRGAVDLKAAQGKTGMLLLDPTFLVVNTGSTNLTPTACPINYTSNSIGGIVNKTDLGGALNSCNVTLQTTGGGDIAVNDPIIGWSSATTLFLKSDGNVVWEALGGVSDFTPAQHGSLNIQATGDITFGAQSGFSGAIVGFHTQTGNITLDATGTISFNTGATGDSSNQIGLMTEVGTLTMTAGALDIEALGHDNTNVINIGFSSTIDDTFGLIINNSMNFDMSGDVSLNAENATVRIGGFINTDDFVSIAGPITFTNIGGRFLATSGTTFSGTSSQLQIGYTLENNLQMGLAELLDVGTAFENIGSDVILTINGGNLQIGHTTVDPVYTVIADINFDQVGGSFQMLDTGPALSSPNFLQIGHRNSINTPNFHSFTMEGNIAIGSLSPIQGDLTISNENNIVFIGHTGILQDDTVRGDITINAAGGAPSISISNGIGSLSIAGIGHIFSITTPHSANTNTIGPTTMNIRADHGISLTSTSTNLAYIGFYPYSTSPTQNIMINALNITTLAGAPVVVTGGTNPANGVALIGAINKAGSIVCPINIQGGPNLQLAVPSGTGIAEIVNQRPGMSTVSDINIDAQVMTLSGGSGTCLISSGHDLNAMASTGSVMLSGNSSMSAQGSQTTIAGQNMSLLQGSQMTAMSGNLNLVIDNLFPVAPFIGPSTFTLDGTSSLFAGGALKIYTAIRSQNTVSGLINGLQFIPGPLFVNSSREQWGTYYSFAGLGFPLTFFYKDGAAPSASPGTMRGFLNATQEYLQDMQRFEDLIVYEEILDLESDLRFEQGHEKKQQLIRSRRDFHLKWLEPIIYFGTP